MTEGCNFCTYANSTLCYSGRAPAPLMRRSSRTSREGPAPRGGVEECQHITAGRQCDASWISQVGTFCIPSEAAIERLDLSLRRELGLRILGSSWSVNKTNWIISNHRLLSADFNILN